MYGPYIGYLDDLSIKKNRADRIARQGNFTIEESKIVFNFDNGNMKEIKFEEIESVGPQKIRIPKETKDPLITLKDGTKFILSISTLAMRGGYLDYTNSRELSDAYREIRRGNKYITKLLKSLIK